MKAILTIGILATLALGYVMWQPTPTIVGGIPDNEVAFYALVEPDTGKVLEVHETSMEMLNTGRWGDPANYVLYTPAKKNRPDIGDTYDKTNDMFVKPQYDPSTVLDAETGQWVDPNLMMNMLIASSSEIL